MHKDDKATKEAIRKLILDSIQIDKALREQYHVETKFIFIRDRLLALQARVEEELQLQQMETGGSAQTLGADEVPVYVHIFNAQGLAFNTWQKMVNPSVFYEYSVNRPIYTDKAQIESFIRSRPNTVQHGFLTVAIKADAILPVAHDQAPPKDQIGNPLVKIREGSLIFKKLLAFTHQKTDYVVDSEGHIVKKPD